MGPQSLAAAGLVLLLLYLTGRFLWLYNKDAAQAQAAAAAAAASSSASQRPSAAAAGATSSSLPAASLLPRRAVTLSSSSLLPVFFVLHVAVPGPGAERPECAVCRLAEFGEREAGRLLPRCGHAFHEECIATWLRVSTTCPLCRAFVAIK